MRNINDIENLRRLGNQLLRARKAKGLTVRQTSERCDIDNSKIIKIEKGTVNITFLTLLALTKELDVDAIYFLRDYR